MGGEGAKAITGRKVFFLYPHSVIQDEMVEELIAKGFEVYFLHDEKKARRLLKKHSDAIVFINIDEALPEEEWQEYIRTLMSAPETAGVGVGVLTYNESRALAEKYLMDLMVPCGYITLSLGLRQSTDTVLKMLEANEAKGRRKYVRVTCTGGSAATFNVRIGDQTHTGVIKDISLVGMACTFDRPVNVQLKKILPDVQLKLKTSLAMVSGVVAGIRRNGDTQYVVMFGRKMLSGTREKITRFVHTSLQEIMERELARV